MDIPGFCNSPSFSIITSQTVCSSLNEDLEIIFILKSGGWILFDESDTTYAVSENDIMVINRYQSRILTLNTGGMALAMHIPYDLIISLCIEQMNVFFECKSFLSSKERQGPFDIIRNDLAQAFMIFYKGESHPPVMLRSQAGILLSNLVKYFSSAKNAEPKLGTFGRENLRYITDYIHRHYKEEITLGVLAEKVHLSSSYLSRMFQKQLGQTFTSYLSDIRLHHAITLLAGEQTVTEIAMEIGFPNPNIFIDVFKQRFGMTPGQYRKLNEKDNNISTPSDLHEFSDVFNILVKYSKQTQPANNQTFELIEVVSDLTSKMYMLKHKWHTLVNAGYAKDLLIPAVRNQLEQIQRDIGFRYIRCKGYLDDDMRTCTLAWDTKGKINYNFVNIDECIDYILSLGAEPWFELNHMPTAFAHKGDVARMGFSAIFYPENLSDWLNLIEALLLHLLKKYGAKAVSSWVFVPFVSLTYQKYGIFTLEEYCVLYNKTVQLLRKILPEIKIAGASTQLEDIDLTKLFLKRCIKAGTLPDILVMQSFHTVDPKSEGVGLSLLAENETWPLATSGDERHVECHLRCLKHILEQLHVSYLPIVLSEWNSTIWQRDLSNDTSYKSAYFFKTILENYDDLDGMGYWSLSDNIQEMLPSEVIFHGGFGLFTRSSLPKASYRALELINKMGNTLVKKGDGYFIVRTDNGIQIYLYNYVHYDTLYRYRHAPHLTLTDRYNVFNPCQPKQYRIHLKNMERGKYCIRKYSIGPTGGNAYDAWIQIGAPDIQAEDYSYIEHRSYPCYSSRTENIETEHIELSLLQPHEVQLITLTKEAAD